MPTPEPFLSSWKRVAGAGAFCLGGIGGAWWGFHDIAVFNRASGGKASIVETQSMLGLPLMGLALVVIGTMFLMPATSTRSRLLQERFAIGILVSLVVGALLSLAGSPIINTVMNSYDYRSVRCSTAAEQRLSLGRHQA